MLRNAVYDKLLIVTYPQFIRSVLKMSQTFTKQIGKESFTILVDVHLDKTTSSVWVANLAWDHIPTPTNIQSLSEKDPASSIKELCSFR